MQLLPSLLSELQAVCATWLGGNGASMTGASSGAYSAASSPTEPERRLEFGEALFAIDFGAAEADAAPFRDRVQRGVLQELRGRPLEPGVRRLREPGAKLLDQPRFAEAGLTDDQREPGSALSGDRKEYSLGIATVYRYQSNIWRSYS